MPGFEVWGGVRIPQCQSAGNSAEGAGWAEARSEMSSRARRGSPRRCRFARARVGAAQGVEKRRLGLMLVMRERAKLAVHQHIVVADDHIQRRPQLVRHGGEKVGLDPVGAFDLVDQARVLEGQRRQLSDAMRDAFLLQGKRLWRTPVARAEHADQLWTAAQANQQRCAQVRLRGHCHQGGAGGIGGGVHRLAALQAADDRGGQRLRQPQDTQRFPLLRCVPGVRHRRKCPFVRPPEKGVTGVARQHFGGQLAYPVEDPRGIQQRNEFGRYSLPRAAVTCASSRHALSARRRARRTSASCSARATDGPRRVRQGIW